MSAKKYDWEIFENKSCEIQSLIFCTKPRFKKNIENSNRKVKNKFENLRIWKQIRDMRIENRKSRSKIVGFSILRFVFPKCSRFSRFLFSTFLRFLRFSDFFHFFLIFSDVSFFGEFSFVFPQNLEIFQLFWSFSNFRFSTQIN